MVWENSYCFRGGLPFSLLSLCRLSKLDRYSGCSRDGFCPFHTHTHNTSPLPSCFLPIASIDRPSSQFVHESTALVLRIHQSAYTIRSVRPPTPEDFTPVLSILGPLSFERGRLIVPPTLSCIFLPPCYVLPLFFMMMIIILSFFFVFFVCLPRRNTD